MCMLERATKSNGEHYYEMLLIYVDDILAVRDCKEVGWYHRFKV